MVFVNFLFLDRNSSFMKHCIDKESAINNKVIQIHQFQSIQILSNIYLLSVSFLLVKEKWGNQL